MQGKGLINSSGADCRTPNVVAGTYGLAAIRCWYVAMIEVIVVSVIVPEVFNKFLLHTTPFEQHHRNPLDNTTGIRLQR